MLRGPADADAFRVKVGRYGDRWYHDPLPTCDVAEATPDAWPSVSAVKNAWPKYLTDWAARAVAEYAVNNVNAWAGLDTKAAIDLLAKAHQRSRDNAAGRGTATHAILEAVAEGRPLPDVAVVDAGQWADAARLLIDEVQPEWLLSEAVVINRTIGCGGTLDAVWRVDGRNYVVDFKTRAAGKHAAYDDEGAQLGAYGSADYAIVERDGHAVRARLPELDGGLVASITPEGYRLFPVDLERATSLFVDLHRFWKSKQSTPVGKPMQLRGNGGGSVRVAPTTVAASTNVVAMPINPATLRDRVQAIVDAGHASTLTKMWPADLPTFKHGELTQDQLRRIEALVSATERETEMPFGPDTAKADLAYALEAFTPDERAALVAEAGQGKPLDAFTHDNIRKLRALLVGIDHLRVAFTYEGNAPVLVTTT